MCTFACMCPCPHQSCNSFGLPDCTFTHATNATTQQSYARTPTIDARMEMLRHIQDHATAAAPILHPRSYGPTPPPWRIRCQGPRRCRACGPACGWAGGRACGRACVRAGLRAGGRVGVHVFECVCVRVCAHACMHAYVCALACMHVYACACAHVCVRASVSVSMSVSVSVFMRVHMCDMHVCIHPLLVFCTHVCMSSIRMDV